MLKWVGRSGLFYSGDSGPRPEGYDILQERKVRFARGNVSNVIKVEFVDEFIDDMFTLVIRKKGGIYIYLFFSLGCVSYIRQTF